MTSLCPLCDHYYSGADELCPVCFSTPIIGLSVRLNDLVSEIRVQCVEPWALPVLDWLSARMRKLQREDVSQ